MSKIFRMRLTTGNHQLSAVIGANPSYLIMDGFLRRIWANRGIDKVVVISKGVFLVRFHNLADCDVVLAEGFQFFDKKPVIVKKWNPDMDFKKEDIKLCLYGFNFLLLI